jgi:hypothetical protein
MPLQGAGLEHEVSVEHCPRPLSTLLLSFVVVGCWWLVVAVIAVVVAIVVVVEVEVAVVDDVVDAVVVDVWVCGCCRRGRCYICMCLCVCL